MNSTLIEKPLKKEFYKIFQMGKIISKILNVFIETVARSVGDCGKMIEDKFRC